MRIDDINEGRDNPLAALEARVARLEAADPLGNAAVTRGSTRFFGLESLKVIGSALVSGLLDITGTLKVAGQLTMTGIFTATGTTNLNGPVNIAGTQTVTGVLNVNGPWNMAGAGGITGDLALTGNTVLTGNLTVNGTGKINVGTGFVLEPIGSTGGQIRSPGQMTIRTVDGLYVFGTISTIQAGSFGSLSSLGTLSALGATTLAATTTGALTASSATVSGGLTAASAIVNGNVNINSGGALAMALTTAPSGSVAVMWNPTTGRFHRA